MPTDRAGNFSVTIPFNDLARGLRPTKRAPRNSKFLVDCVGVIGLDGVLAVLDDLSESQIDTTALNTAEFPYPQLFVFTECIAIALEDAIYVYSGGSLTKVLDLGGYEGDIWSAIDMIDFIYMSNGKVAIERFKGVWSITTSYPVASGICNYNGQVLIGAPGVEVS
jgi:hypothetical protein